MHTLTAAEACSVGSHGSHSFPDGGRCACGVTYGQMLDNVAREHGFSDWEALRWDGWKQHQHDDGSACAGYLCYECNERLCRKHLKEHKAAVHGEPITEDVCTGCETPLGVAATLSSPAGAPWCGQCPRWWFE